MSELTIKKQEDRDCNHLKISGKINEHASFQGVDFGTAPTIKIDLTEVTAINSVGIRTWLGFIKTIPQDRIVSFKNLPKVLVDQCNMIKGFIPIWAHIENFEVPYYCPSCESVTKIFFSVTSLESEKLKQTKVVCDHCQKKTELDVLPENYLKFLKER